MTVFRFGLNKLANKACQGWLALDSPHPNPLSMGEGTLKV